MATIVDYSCNNYLIVDFFNLSKNQIDRLDFNLNKIKIEKCINHHLLTTLIELQNADGGFAVYFRMKTKTFPLGVNFI